MFKLDIYLLDNLNFIVDEISINKPRTYRELENTIVQKIKNLPKSYDKFIYRNKQEILINQNHKYKDVNDLLFIRDNDNNNLKRSKYDIIMDLLPSSKQQKLDLKFNCTNCLEVIKNENPYLCYKCQKIFHEKCLKDWDNKCKSLNKIFNCPSCRDELPLEKWNKKLEHEENRNDFTKLINKVYEDKLNNNLLNNLLLIKDKKIYDLIQNKKKINELLKRFKNYTDKSISIFNNIINQINSIHSLLKLEKNNRLNDLIKKLTLEKINDLSNLLNEEFHFLKNKINKNTYRNKALMINKESEISYINIKELNNNSGIVKIPSSPKLEHNESESQNIYFDFGFNDLNNLKQKKENINNKINEDIPKSLTASKVKKIINMSNLPETFGSVEINNYNQDKPKYSIQTNVQRNINYDLNQEDSEKDVISLSNNLINQDILMTTKITEKTEDIQAEDYSQYFKDEQPLSNQFIEEKNYLNEPINLQGVNINFSQPQQNINNNYNDEINKIIFENINFSSNIEVNNQNQIDIQNYMNQNNTYDFNNQQIINENEIKDNNESQNYMLQNNYKPLKRDKVSALSKDEQDKFNTVN